MEFLTNNWEMISLVLTIAIPALAPAKYAAKINIVTKVVRNIAIVLEKLDGSKAGLTLKPAVEKQIKNEVISKIGEVVSSKDERFNKKDVVLILNAVSKSDGLRNITTELKNFTKAL